MKLRKFHYLGRGIIEFQSHFLLAKAKGSSNTFLPGGHIELGESIPDCIAREIYEEFGFTALVGRYLGAIEHSWSDDLVDHFEINHLFHTTLPSLTSFSDIVSLESHLDFIWAKPTELSDYNLQPAPLVSLLRRPLPSVTPYWGSTLKITEQDAGVNG